MEIRDRPDHDPVADMLLVDAYMRWALLAAEEVIGRNGLAVVLRQAGLSQLIGNYPPEQLKATSGLTFYHYASLNAGLLNFFGRSARSMVLRIGRQTARLAIEHQSALFGTAALIASKVLPFATQVKLGLSAMQAGLRRLSQAVNQDRRLAIEDRGEAWAYIDYTCSMSAGKQADEPIGYIQCGVLQEALHWQTGREFTVEQIACRSMGAPASIWLVSKVPSLPVS
ncbi:4-vinyl reductase [uncultured Chloroflexus sp.]|uniref:4-vinyl reductase n=1 Tax=uncultured Chloroflexus sp. TaxID=214040 RepID=UPI00262D2449|nr:4-vinyl reductase [uncultured Chloroflexus sp.]